VITANKVEKTISPRKAFNDTAKATKIALWWLRHYESIMHFWRGFSWVWVIGVLLCAIVGDVDLAHAIFIIFLVGIIANTGIYLGIRTVSSHLKRLEDGPAKETAHELMIKIMKETIGDVRSERA
jgi:hypothetical protein